MYKISSVLLLVVSVLFINGCSNTNTHNTPDVQEPKRHHKLLSNMDKTPTASLAEKAEKFIKGKTTYADVVRELGEADRKFDFRDGIWVDYEGYITSSHGVSKESTLHMRFDKYKVLYLKVVN